MSEADIDIISINETKLDSLINDNEVYIPGYEIVRKDRKTNGRHGGGGVYAFMQNAILTTKFVKTLAVMN